MDLFINEPRRQRRCGRGHSVLVYTVALLAVLTSFHPVLAGEKTPVFPYQGEVEEITVDQALTTGIEVGTRFELALALPANPVNIEVGHRHLAFDYDDGLWVSIGASTLSSYGFEKGCCLVYKTIKRYFSGGNPPERPGSVDAIRFLKRSLANLAGKRVIGEVLYWHEPPFDVYIFSTPLSMAAPGVKNPGKTCEALILDKRNKARLLRLSAAYMDAGPEPNIFAVDGVSCGFVKSIIATLETR